MTRTRSRKKNQPDLYEPHVRFNWGFHDAAWEVRNHRERLNVGVGPQTTGVVSREYDAAYYEGHVRGLAWARAGKYIEGKTLSTEAWEEYEREVRR